MQKILWILSSFSGKQLDNKTWQSIKDLSQDYNLIPEGVIVTKESYANDELPVFIFNQKDNENFSLYYLIKNMELNDYDTIIFCDCNYADNTEMLSNMLAQYVNGANVVHIKKTRTKFAQMTSLGVKYVFDKMSNFIVGAKESDYIKNIVLFDNNVIQLLEEFPERAGLIKETNYLTNASKGIIATKEDFKPAKSKQIEWVHYTLSAVEFTLALALFILMIIFPQNLSNVFWMIIFMAILFITSFIQFSFARVNKFVKVSKLKEEPDIIVPDGNDKQIEEVEMKEVQSKPKTKTTKSTKVTQTKPNTQVKKSATKKSKVKTETKQKTTKNVKTIEKPQTKAKTTKKPEVKQVAEKLVKEKSKNIKQSKNSGVKTTTKSQTKKVTTKDAKKKESNAEVKSKKATKKPKIVKEN